MYYTHDISTPANTGKSEPVETTITLPPGEIVEASVRFPANAGGQLHLQISNGLYQVWPANWDGDIKGDNEVILIDNGRIILQGEGQFVARTWNDDDMFPHSLILRFLVGGLVHPDPEAEPMLWMKRIAHLLGYKEPWTIMQATVEAA